MDNLCHTLAGAALGEAGLKRRTGLGMATLLIGANLPDLDVLAIPLGHGIDFRRGWTHGVLALAILPFLLTGAMLLWSRWRPPREPVRPGWILALSAISILSHPALDWLNTYGVRLLMPFSGRWFYGDAVFIIDPWMWAALAVGVVAARRRASPLPARLAIGGVLAYTVAMAASSALLEGRILDALRDRDVEVMVGPVPVNPFQREIVVRDGEVYRFGLVNFRPEPETRLFGELVLPANADDPRARAAAEHPDVRRFLVWSRFPFFVPQRDGTVRVDDARYTTGPRASFAAVRVSVPAETPPPAAP